MAPDHLVFVYGTLKRGEPNHEVADRPDLGVTEFYSRAVSVDKWPLIVSPDYYNTPFMLDKEGTGKRVEGEVFRVDDVMLKEMDKLEDHPNFYERREHQFELTTPDGAHTGNIITCYVYVLTDFRLGLLDLTYLERYSVKEQPFYVMPRDRAKGESMIKRKQFIKLP